MSLGKLADYSSYVVAFETLQRAWLAREEGSAAEPRTALISILQTALQDRQDGGDEHCRPPGLLQSAELALTGPTQEKRICISIADLQKLIDDLSSPVIQMTDDLFDRLSNVSVEFSQEISPSDYE